MIIKRCDLNIQNSCMCHKVTDSRTDTDLPFAFAPSLRCVFLVVFVIQVVQEVVGLQDSLLTRWRRSEDTQKEAPPPFDCFLVSTCCAKQKRFDGSTSCAIQF